MKTHSATFNINVTGALSAIAANGRGYLAPGQAVAVLSVRVDGNLHAANSVIWNAAGHILTLHYEGTEGTAVVAVRAKPTHMTLELSELRASHHVEWVAWGPYPFTLGSSGTLTAAMRYSSIGPEANSRFRHRRRGQALAISASPA